MPTKKRKKVAKQEAGGSKKAKQKKQKTIPTLKYGAPVSMLSKGAENTLIPYTVGFVEKEQEEKEETTEKIETISKYMMRGFGGATFKSSVKEHESMADAVKYINSQVRKKVKGKKNNDGGPRLNTFRIIKKNSICEDKSPHVNHGLSDIYTQCGIPPCCPNLSCDNCFRGL